MIRAINDEISSYASRSPEDLVKGVAASFTWSDGLSGRLVGTVRREHEEDASIDNRRRKNDAPKLGFGKAEDGGFLAPVDDV